MAFKVHRMVRDQANGELNPMKNQWSLGLICFLGLFAWGAKEQVQTRTKAQEQSDCLKILDEFGESGNTDSFVKTFTQCSAEYLEGWDDLTLDNRWNVLYGAERTKSSFFHGVALETLLLERAKPAEGTYDTDEYELVRIRSITYLSLMLKRDSIGILVGTMHKRLDASCVYAAKRLLDLDSKTAKAEITTVLARHERKAIECTNERFARNLRKLL